MPITYTECPKDVEDIAGQVIREHHLRLLSPNMVSITYLFAHGPRDEATGEVTGPAVTHNGYECLAVVKVNSLKDRVEGKSDCTITIDGDRWSDHSHETKKAILDHELAHVIPTNKTDDCNRPVLKLRKHDIHIGGFVDVIQRNREHAIEYQQMCEAGKKVRKVLQNTMWG